MNETSPRPFAFVLMPFSKDFDDIYSLGIKSAAEEAGYYCERIDEQIFEETMLARIYNQIAKADIIIADMTERNPNVFYEAGYAHALNKRTILLTKESDDIPFDLKHYYHIVYKNRIGDLKSELKQRLIYYKEHPEKNSSDPFQSIQLRANGNAIDILSNDEQTIDAINQIDTSDYYPGHYANLDLSIHLPPDSPEEDLTFQAILISSSKYPECIIRTNHSHHRIYTSISESNDRIIHKPIDSIYVNRGSWDTMPFHLRIPWGNSKIESDHLVLRLICEGIVRDIKLFMRVP